MTFPEPASVLLPRPAWFVLRNHCRPILVQLLTGAPVFFRSLTVGQIWQDINFHCFSHPGSQIYSTCVSEGTNQSFACFTKAGKWAQCDSEKCPLNKISNRGIVKSTGRKSLHLHTIVSIPKSGLIVTGGALNPTSIETFPADASCNIPPFPAPGCFL